MSWLEKIAVIVTILAGVAYLVIEISSRIPPLADYLTIQPPATPNLIVPVSIIIFVIIGILAHFISLEKKEKIDPSLDQLNLRYSQGEISREDYLKLKKDLEKS